MKFIQWGILLALAAIPSEAQVPVREVILSWIAPTELVDGTPIPAGAIQNFTVEWQFNDTVDWKVISTLAGTSLGMKHSNLPTGKHCYRVTATVANVPSLPSDFTQAACKIFPAAAPKPPTMVKAL